MNWAGDIIQLMTGEMCNDGGKQMRGKIPYCNRGLLFNFKNCSRLQYIFCYKNVFKIDLIDQK